MKRITTRKLAVFALFSLITIVSSMPTVSISSGQIGEDLRAHPLYITSLAGTSTPHGYSPNQIRTAYNLPPFGGAGTTIAIIDAYHTPTLLADYTAFCHQYDLPDNSSGNLIVHTMTGATQNVKWAQETCLDVEWAHAIAPDATILLVEAKDDSTGSMFAAVSYATSQPGVVAVSMSWGLSETDLSKYYETTFDKYFDEAGIVFFASSGDSGAETIYPAVSVNVVAVGGTTLNLRSDGTVVSETAWNGSGGGVSLYESMPLYQVNYGLKGSNRCVPDVSYNANPNTGVSVYYNGAWYTYGGTSAGAPQWAAIHSLGVSASNTNLYSKAKTAYSTYFRDITSGSNGFNATSGYDYITGLGSPLTYRFDGSLEVSPTSGAPGTTISLYGAGLTGSSVNISYLNPVTSTWVSLINNTAVTSGSFTVTTTVPDLLQANSLGDATAGYDNIIFEVVDNSDDRSYNESVPFTEYRRGLSQVGDSKAFGLYGNNTSLASSVFVQNGETIPVTGEWFSPGNATILWDSTNISTTAIDQTGQFSAAITIPTSTLGQHTLTIRDATTSFSVNITYAPKVSNDYIDTWHKSDFTVNIAVDSPVNETFYRINDAETQNVTANGQPSFTVEDANNTLEYWCTWSANGAAFTETEHTIITGIKLDKTAPVGSITTNNIAQSPNITVYVNAIDAVSGVSAMQFSNDGISWSSWEPYASTKTWALDDGDGAKMVCVKFMDAAGLTSPMYSVAVTLMAPAASPQATYQPSSTSTKTPSPSPMSSSNPSPTPVPEFSAEIAVLIFAAASLIAFLFAKKQGKILQYSF